MKERAATPANIPTVRFLTAAIQPVHVIMITATNVTALSVQVVAGRDTPKTAMVSALRAALTPAIGALPVAQTKTVVPSKPTLQAPP